MANICSYEMKIKGKRENVDKMISYLNPLSDKRFFRIFDSHVDEREDNGEESIAFVWGSCAWSVYSCMFNGRLAYCNKEEENESEISNYVHITQVTKDLELQVEIFSEEPGCEFMEHFIVVNGEVKVDDCVEYRELYDEDGEPILDENGEQMSEGGLDWEYSI